MRYFSKSKLRFAHFHQEKYVKFSGLCVLFNLKLSRFIVSLFETARLLYQVHLSLSTVFLIVLKVFSNFITLLEQPRYNIKFLIPCQQLFKFVFKNFLNCPQMTVLLFYSLFLLLSSLFYFFTQPDILHFNRLNYFTFLMTTLYNLLFL